MITTKQFEMVTSLKKKRSELKKIKYYFENNQYVSHYVGAFTVNTAGGGRATINSHDMNDVNESIYIHMSGFSKRMRDEFICEVSREIEKIDDEIAQYIYLLD